jgi:hypothetical protein
MEQQSSSSRRGRWAFGLTVAAFAWGSALFVAAFVVPIYSSNSSATGASVSSSPSTLVAVNGLWVLGPVAIPALLAGIVGLALHRKCSRGNRASGRLAWVLTWLLAAFSVLTGFSIGVFVLPLAVLLLGAASLTPSGAQPAA